MSIRNATAKLFLVALVSSAVPAAEIDSNLEAAMDAAAPGEHVKALLYLHDQIDYDSLNAQFKAERATRAHRHQVGMELLQGMAEHSQQELLAAIGQLEATGEVAGHRSFWIANLVQVEATAEAIEVLSNHDDVMMMYLDHPIELVAPVEQDTKPVDLDRGAVAEPGVTAVRAEECWAAGYDGQGALVANIDTGVDVTHPCLSSRWRGNEPGYAQEWAWHDPYLNQFPPYDYNGHGTHTMGTVVGGSPGQIVGVAPGAQWIASAPIDRESIEQTVSDAIEAFQWMTDPDGDPATSWDVPNVCSNSWGLVTGHGYPECDQTFWSYVDNCELLGTVVLFSAGNEGSEGLRRPSDRATDEYRICAVAAIDPYSANWPVASFSSRGPTYCTLDGSAAIKPDISAPGVNTHSAYPGGLYASLSGTSMASPHVNGVVAIMTQANPNLPPEVIKQIIYDTAYDLGTFGKDNDYGWGMIDAWESLQAALSTVSLIFNYPDGRPALIEPAGGQTLRISITGNDVAIPDTALLHVRTSGMIWQDYPVTHIIGDVYEVVFPAFDCGEPIDWYLSIETVEGDYVTSPFSAPDGVYTADAWSGIEVVFEEDFEIALGWTVEGDAVTGQWERAVPLWSGLRCEPASDADESGNCYVTGNSTSEEDIDDGSTILTSPNMTATSDSTLVYQRWYNNGSNCGGADPHNDIFVVEFSIDGGSTWSTLEIVGPAGDGVDGGWIQASFELGDVVGFQDTEEFRLRFTASDLNAGSVVEAGVDAINITKAYCNDSEIPGDVNGDGSVNVEDLLYVISNWGDPYTVEDLLEVIANWGA